MNTVETRSAARSLAKTIVPGRKSVVRSRLSVCRSRSLVMLPAENTGPTSRLKVIT